MHSNYCSFRPPVLNKLICFLLRYLRSNISNRFRALFNLCTRFLWIVVELLPLICGHVKNQRCLFYSGRLFVCSRQGKERPLHHHSAKHALRFIRGHVLEVHLRHSRCEWLKWLIELRYKIAIGLIFRFILTVSLCSRINISCWLDYLVLFECYVYNVTEWINRLIALFECGYLLPPFITSKNWMNVRQPQHHLFSQVNFSLKALKASFLLLPDTDRIKRLSYFNFLHLLSAISVNSCDNRRESTLAT